MSYSVDKKTGEITIGGWQKGIAPSPHSGLGDIKCGNISTEMGEVSVNYSRSSLVNTIVAPGGGTFTASNGSDVLTYPGTQLKNGTWILVATSTVTGFTAGNYYFVTTDFGVGSTSYQLSATFNVAGGKIVAGSGGTLTFGTLNMSTPVDYAIEQTSTFDQYRYYILDSANVIWVSGAGGVPGVAGRLSTSTVWASVSAGGSTAGATAGTNTTGLAIIYGTTSGKITNTYLLAFGDGTGTGTNGITYLKVAASGGGFTGGAFTVLSDTKFYGGFSHRAILANDQVVYYCDGPTIGCIYQNAPATPLDFTSSSTYTLVKSEYYLNPTDAATRIAQIPNGGGVGIIVGGLQNNLYTYPSAKSSSANTGQQTNILWMPEANTQYLLSCNNFVIVFCGSKGNVYLTNGSSVVPILSVPDYIAGSANFVQEPYFTWGGAMYLRGRVWFGIQDSTSTHTGNCGGAWSFVPNFAAFAEQDTGTALRYENHNASLSGSSSYTAYPTVLFSGQDTQAQGGANNNVNGPQYVAGWGQTGGSQVATALDFSASTPYTDGSTIIESDVIPVGTFLTNRTFEQIEYKLAAALVAGESVAFKYRLDLEQPFVAAGTIQQPANTTTDPTVSGYCPINFQNAEIVQLQIILTSTATNPSFVRLQEVYIR